MITQKIPCQGAPPKLSIHWSVLWPDRRFSAKRRLEEYDRQSVRRKNSAVREYLEGVVATGFDGFGRIPDWDSARKIKHKGFDVRVFPHEFTPVSDENLALYINEGSHVLVPGDTAEEQLIQAVLDKEQREVYDAALVDGANPAQAIMTTLGGDPTGNSTMPAIGWYKCIPEYAQHFCRDSEMEPEDLKYLQEKYGEPETKPPKKRRRKIR